MTRAVPMVSYEDVATASDWIQDALGFNEVTRIADETGRAAHVELRRDGASVMLGRPGSEYRSPRRHAKECSIARAWLDTPYVVDGVLLEVDDFDDALERARTGGGEVIRGPEEQPQGRLATIADPEGHRWMLLQPRG